MKVILIPLSVETKSVPLPKWNATERDFLKTDAALRRMLRACKVPDHYWRRHDAVNLIERYQDMPSDVAFIEFWILPHKQWRSKYYNVTALKP